MGWSGGTFTRSNGVYTGSTVWATDEANSIDIESARHDTHDQDLAAGINATLTKDGSNSPSAHLGWLHTEVAGTAAGSSNAYTLSLTNAPGAYATHQRFWFIPNHTNTGAATLNVNSLGAKNIKRVFGGTVADLAAGQIQNNSPVELYYDGTQFIILNPAHANILDRDPGITTVSNSTTKTDLCSFTVPAECLSSGNGLELILFGTAANASGANNDFTFTVELGSTVLFSKAYTQATGANTHGYDLKATIGAQDSNAAQNASSILVYADSAGDTSTAASVGTVFKAWESTVTEDNSSSLTLKATITHSVMATTVITTMQNSFVRLL